MRQRSRFTASILATFVCQVSAGIGLSTQICLAAPVPQVEVGLSNFQHARFAEAQAAWRQAAQAGDPRGALYLGVMFDSGVGAARDFNEAMRWYRQAAAGGSAVAAFNIGVLYDGGFGVAPDPSEAAAWYEKAASAGFGRAEYNLAMLYESGAGVPRDRNRAEALYRSAFAHGIPAAGEHLAAFRDSLQPPVREPAAPGHRERPKLPVQGADSPKVDSLNLDSSQDDDPKPDSHGADDAATREFERAQRSVLTRGAANSSRAARLFRRAAEKHNALAEYDLGYCFEHGLGVHADPAAAALWYNRAANDSSDNSLRAMAQTSAGNVQSQPAAASRPANQAY